MAKIEIKSKDVTSFPGDAEHLYIVYTNDFGEKKIFRGGPEGNNVKGMLWGDIEVVDGIYNEQSVDFDKSGTHKSKVIFEGTDSEMYQKVDLMKAEMKIALS
tara:strand:- start:704 stop:1009 length:306 start_codon:yes stop_codon:yes gene_type:complete